MAAEETYEGRPIPERLGPEHYAPRHHRVNNIVEVSPVGVEAEIHDLVRRGVGQAPQKRAETSATADPLPENVDTMIGHAVGASMEEIDRLIGELQNVRDMLRKEGERLSREVSGYASLNHSVKTAMKTIRENLSRWQVPKRAASDREDDPAA